MNRVFTSFTITDFNKTKQQVLNWATQFDTCCFLDNNQYESTGHSHECLAGVGIIKSMEANAGNAFEQLKKFAAKNNDWLFGHFGYELKNETVVSSSCRNDKIEFPDLFFFVPETIIELEKNKITIGSLIKDNENIFQQIQEILIDQADRSQQRIAINQRISKEDYIASIEKLRRHILRGDCYEINFCQEFYAEDVNLEPLQTYMALIEISPMPFAGFYKLGDRYLLCASPERYLKRISATLLSQPIKGTSARDKNNINVDNRFKDELFHSSKDRSENVMVVDLVRNDLSKVCEEGSVMVDELYGIYSFPLIHQMISTVSGKLHRDKNWVDIISATFPMGSMTGAPKKRVLELIDQYEQSKRGLFSGALGYVTPERDFDFNVVIRSILYNKDNKYLSYQVGSGITFYSDAEKEYEECLLKAAAIKKVLNT